MVKKNTTSKTAKAGAKTPAKAKLNSPANALVKELVTEASIKATFENEAPKANEMPNVQKPKKEYYLGKVTIMNTTLNEILLNTGVANQTIRIAPKEIRQIDREIYLDLMKIQVVKNWFDKGILVTSTVDANETSLHEAVVPENLKNPVERTDSVSTVAASVTKFEQDGTVQINL